MKFKKTKKEEKPRFVLTLPIITELWQEDILNTRFYITTKVYNAVLNKALNKYKEMVKTKAWRSNQDILCELLGN